MRLLDGLTNLKHSQLKIGEKYLLWDHFDCPAIGRVCSYYGRIDVKAVQGKTPHNNFILVFKNASKHNSVFCGVALTNKNYGIQIYGDTYELLKQEATSYLVIEREVPTTVVETL